MLKKKLGTEAIKKDWNSRNNLKSHFKIPSTLIIPKDFEKIGDYAFYGCRQATIILKKHKKDFRYIGTSAFEGCKDVKEETRN